jgi:helicase
VLLAAANVKEEAWEAAGHGLLTAALIEALRAAPAEVEVVGLLADVTSRVRAEAQRLGSIQTPKWVGDFEGGFTMQPLRAGAHYYHAFPKHTGLHVSADLRELTGFGLPEAILTRWAELFPAGLNDLQLAAVNEYRVLDGQSVLVLPLPAAARRSLGRWPPSKRRSACSAPCFWYRIRLWPMRSTSNSTPCTALSWGCG